MSRSAPGARAIVRAVATSATLIVLVGGGPAALQVPPVTALVDVNVVPMDVERVLRGQTVLVREGRIAEIGPSASVRVPDGAARVEGRGRYVIPGLAEMHGHLMPPANQAGTSLEALNERILELNAIHGITTIRGMLGHPYHLTLRARVAKGELLGPTIYTSGPSLNGNSAKDEATAVRMVEEQKAAGYDFLKIHPGLTRPVFDAMAAAAARVGITYQGHVPADVGIDRALAAPYRAIDHLDGYVEALAGWKPGSGAPAPGFFGSRLTAGIDRSRIAALAAATKKAGVWMVPTEAVVHSFLAPEPVAELAKRPDLALVPSFLSEGWLKQKQAFNDQTGIGTAEERERFFALRRELIKALHGAGVKILSGADAPQVMNVPGPATHRELALLAAAGLTPFQVLESSTRNVAEFLGASDRGTIAAGKVADLVLLDASPLERIEHTTRIAGVMVRGRWIDAGEIAKRLKK
jgi:imidazolonepropionase-like amidohydrolase